jgi:phosphoglycerol transferase MdoB-like AlkP superfamily enzyme
MERNAPRRAPHVSQRLRPTLMLVLGLLAIFTGFRAGLLAKAPSARENVTSRQLVRCFTVGFQFDACPIACIAVPLGLVLAVAPPEAFGKKWFRRCVTGYVVATLGLVLFAEIVGAYYFAYNGVRMDWVAADYLRNPREVVGFLWENYPVVWVALAVAALAAGLYWLTARLCWRGEAPSTPVRLRLILAGALIAAGGLAIRGSLAKMPLRLKAAGVSDNGTLNQLANNGIYYFTSAWRAHNRDNRDEAQWYRFPPHARAVEVAQSMLYQKQDVGLHVEGNPLWRRTVTGSPLQDYNVVVFVMESMTGRGVGAMGYSPSYTPNLDALCDEGLFFENAFAVGRRTNRALVGVLCGHPEMAGGSIMTRPHAEGHFLNLPGLFRQRGYKTTFIYGGRNTWDNIRGFFSHNAIEEFIGQDEGLDSAEGANWGVPDEVTLRAAHERFVKYGGQKFFAAILNVSNHEPFIIPPGRVEPVPPSVPDAKILTATRYADWAIGEFFRRARTADYFRKTIFVLVADHGRQELKEGRVNGPQGYRVPLLFYAPGILPARRIATVASQSDIAPTVLAMLGGEFEHCFFGRNLLTVDPNDGFALLQHDSGWLGLVRGDTALAAWRGAKPELQRLLPGGRDAAPLSDPARAAWMQEEMLSDYYMAINLYWEGHYCAPGAGGYPARPGIPSAPRQASEPR